MYPVEQFLRKKIKESGLAPKEIARQAGYANISKGIRRLEAFLPRGQGGGPLAAQLPRILAFPAGALTELIRETEAMIAAEEEACRRAAWRPYLFVVTERRCPSQITICALTGGGRHKRIDLPDDFNGLGAAQQDSLISEGIRLSLERDNGGIRFFGKIRHFILRRDYDEPIAERAVYDLAGELVPDAPLEARAEEGGRVSATIRRGKRDITGILAE